MNENINLCEILKGLKGIELYSTIYGKVILEEVDIYSSYPIIVKASDGTLYFYTNKGLHDADYLGECVLFPSKDQRDWSKFERPISKDTPMMCSNCKSGIWALLYYAYNLEGKHFCYQDGDTSAFSHKTCRPLFVIPFDKFNPNNIEDSLKYNLQKWKH